MTFQPTKLARRRPACKTATIAVLFAMGLLVTRCGVGQAQQPFASDPSPRQSYEESLRERNRLWEEANALLSEGKLRQAVAAGEEMLAIERRLFGDVHAAVAQSLAWLADGYLEMGRMDSARDARREQLDILVDLHGEGDWRAADARWALAHVDLVTELSAANRTALMEANALELEANEAYGDGDDARAVALTRQVLTVRNRLLPDPHPDLARSHKNLGYLFRSQDDYARAEPHLKQSLAMRRRLFPTQQCPRGHPDVAQSHYELAYLYQLQRDFDAAREHYEREFDIRQRLFPVEEYPNGHPELAECLNNLGYLLSLHGDYAGSREYFERLLEMVQRLYPVDEYPNGHVDLAVSLDNLGNVLEEQGESAEALVLVELALAMRQRLFTLDEFPQGHPDLAISLNNVAAVLSSLGDYAGAREHYTQALEMRRRLYPADEWPRGHPDLARSLNNLGVLLCSSNNHDEARGYLQLALEMRQRLYTPEQYPQGHPDLASSLYNLGALLRFLGEEEQALKYSTQALAAYQRLYPEGHPKVAASLNNVGGLLHATGDPAGAQVHYEEALKLLRRIYPAEEYPDGHPDLALCLNNQGGLFESQGKYAQAQPYFEQALAIYERLYPSDRYPQGHPDLRLGLDNLGGTLVATGDIDRALVLLEKADRTERSGLQRFFDLSSAEAMNAFIRSRYGTIDWLVTLATSHGEAVGPAYRCVLGRKTAVLDALLRQREFQRVAAADSRIADQSAELRRLRQQLADMALQPVTQDRARRRQQIAAEANALEQRLLASVNRASGNSEWVDPKIEDLQAELGPRTALLDFIRYQPYDFTAQGDQPRWLPASYVAFIVRGEGQGTEPVLVDLGDTESIDAQVAQLREQVADTGRQLQFASESALVDQYREHATLVSKAVFVPLRAHLAGIETIYIATDGELARVPFEALLDADGNYLVERFAFSYLSGGRDLLREPSEPAKGTIVFAAPDYDLDGQPVVPSETLLAQVNRRAAETWQGDLSSDTRGISWAPLPATESEATQILGLLAMHDVYGPANAFLGSDALEGLLKRMRAPRILHMATHGFYLEQLQPPLPDAGFGRGIDVVSDSASGATVLPNTAAAMESLSNYENPLLRAGIILAGANRRPGEELAAFDESTQRPDDGWVTAEEIGLLDLEGTELVVLSACETGLGDIRTGEGVSGLRRAFIYAGAETLITSLYKVPDEATQQLMTEFYSRLAERATKLAALRGAQLEIIRQRREQHDAAHPFFWASFVLVGDPD